MSQQKQIEQNPLVAVQVNTLSLRINDMITQLSTVLKTMTDENVALKKENDELKAKQKETSKSQ